MNPGFFDKIRPQLIAKYLKPNPMTSGEALIFDDGLIHWSANNDSPEPRIAIQILCVPKDAQPVYFFFDKEHPERFELIEVDSDFFIETDVHELMTRQPQWKSLGFVPNNKPLRDRRRVCGLAGEGTEDSRAGVCRLGRVSERNGADAGSLGLSGPAFFDDPYPAYARLRARREPVYNEATHAWMITRFADVEAVLRDPRISKKIQRETATPFETSVLFRDPPDHGRIRGLLNRVFAEMPENLEDRVLRIADGLIDRMKEGRKADFMRDFALPLPVAVIAEVLGIPAGDTARLHGWSSEFIIDEGVSQAESDQRQYAAICGMEEYFRSLIASGPVGGMIGAMLRADPLGDKLSQDELIGNCILLMVAGHETTVNLLGNGLYLLLQKRERLERVASDPKLLPSMIDETLRFESPVQLGTFRVTAESVEIGGKTIEAGAMISAVIGAANRDPEVFPDPDTFDPGRASNRHLAFGFGPHRCIGAQLARTEARVGFARLFERLPNMALDTVPPTWLGTVLKGIGIRQEVKPWPPHWRHNPVTRGLVELKISL